MRTLKYFLADATKHKARVHQLDFIGAFLQAKVKNRVFVKLDIRYTDYFPEYAKYIGRALRLFMSMYDMTNSGKLFDDELTYIGSKNVSKPDITPRMKYIMVRIEN